MGSCSAHKACRPPFSLTAARVSGTPLDAPDGVGPSPSSCATHEVGRRHRQASSPGRARAMCATPLRDARNGRGLTAGTRRLSSSASGIVRPLVGSWLSRFVASTTFSPKRRP
jgi:hypothetical protein